MRIDIDHDNIKMKENKATDLLYRGFVENLYGNDLNESEVSESQKIFAMTPNATMTQNTDDEPELTDARSTILTVDLSDFLNANETIYDPTNESDDEYAELVDDKNSFLAKPLKQDVNILPSTIITINNDFSPLPTPETDISTKYVEKRHENQPNPFIIRVFPVEIDMDNIESDEKSLTNSNSNDSQKPIKGSSTASTSPLKQHAIDQEDSASQREFTSSSGNEAYYYTSIENRPIASYELPHPPLQNEYPKAIQNNYSPSARIVSHQSGQLYIRPPIPPSLPSIISEPSATFSLVNSKPTIVAQPSFPASAAPLPPSLTSASQAATSTYSASQQYYASPAITSAYSNRQTIKLNQQQPQTREKVIVKVVPAASYYLNDENERKSYFNAVAHGLLNEDGYVFVNDVQRIGSQPSQNVFSVPSITIPFQSQSTVQQSPTPHQYSSVQTQKYQYQRYGSTSNVALPEPRGHATSTPSSSGQSDDSYDGTTSYNVPLKSVGKLAGDNQAVNYNLASLKSSGGIQIGQR